MEVTFKRNSKYGDRLFDNFYKRVSSNTNHTDGVYCDGNKNGSNLISFSQVAFNDFGYGYTVLDDLITRCEAKYNEDTSQNTGYDINANGFWYNLIKHLHNGYSLDAELHQLGGIITVTDTKNFKMSNVRIKSMVNETFVESYSQYADFHGNVFEGVPGDDLIEKLDFPLLDQDRGIANLVYHQANNSSGCCR